MTLVGEMFQKGLSGGLGVCVRVCVCVCIYSQSPGSLPENGSEG